MKEETEFIKKCCEKGIYYRLYDDSDGGVTTMLIGKIGWSLTDMVKRGIVLHNANPNDIFQQAVAVLDENKFVLV